MKLVHLLVLLALAACAACSQPEELPALGDACADIRDCARSPGLVCSQSVCARVTCGRSSQCPVGAACVGGVCGVPECGPEQDACPQGSGCFEGGCVEGLCQRRESCDAGQVCLGTPAQCVAPPATCASDQECAVGTSCKLPLAACVPSCDQGQSCEAGSWCDGRVCRWTCETSADCDPGEGCDQGQCRAPRDCSEEPACPLDRRLRDSVSCECRECLGDLDCAQERGQACVSGSCLFCEALADTPAACESLGLIHDQGCCLSCVTEADCAAVERCERGRCVDPLSRRCISDRDCAREGEVCDRERCGAPPSLTACQGQSDCPAHEACYEDARCHVQGDVCRGCAAPNRCVADVGDARGACVGCRAHCE